MRLPLVTAVTEPTEPMERNGTGQSVSGLALIIHGSHIAATTTAGKVRAHIIITVNLPDNGRGLQPITMRRAPKLIEGKAE